MRRWLSRAGWFLSAGTIVTTASLLPVLLEKPELDWLVWLGVVGNLFGSLLIRLGAPTTYLAAAIVAFFTNMFFVALLLGVIVHLVEKQKRRTVAYL
jgi:hypothetical protein